jgi:hypothetical protein
MYETNLPYLQSELAYRAARMKQGVAGRERRRHTRVRRHTEAAATR